MLPNMELKITSNYGKFGITKFNEPKRVLTLSGDTSIVSEQLKELRLVFELVLWLVLGFVLSESAIIEPTSNWKPLKDIRMWCLIRNHISILSQFGWRVSHQSTLKLISREINSNFYKVATNRFISLGRFTRKSPLSSRLSGPFNSPLFLYRKDDTGLTSPRTVTYTGTMLNREQATWLFE